MIKALRHYSAACHVCGGKGVRQNEFFEICGGPFVWRSRRCRICKYYLLCNRGEWRECSVCHGNGTVHLYCVEEPALEVMELQIPLEAA
jgi:hypothetical protein